MKKYFSLHLAFFFIFIICKVHSANNTCNNAINYNANLSSSTQNYQISDSTIWFKFKTDSAAVRISVNINSSASLMPINIHRIALYSGVCDTLNLVNLSNSISTVNHRLNLFQLELDSTLWYYVKITRQYQPFCGSCDTGLVNLNIEMQEYNMKMPLGGWPQPFLDSCTFSQCENLVCNGGFELHDDLTDAVQGATNFSALEDDVFNWNSYNEPDAYMHTPDYYNTNQGIVNFQIPNLPSVGFVNHLPPMTGFVGSYDGFVGFATSNSSGSYPEALHQSLSTLLVPNRSYYCSYWLRMAPGSARICNNPVALYLTQNPSYNTDFQDVYDGNILPILSYTDSAPLNDTVWRQLSTCFKTTNTLRSLYLLSAYKRANPIDTINPSQNPNLLSVGYYLVDNVMVRPLAFAANEDTVQLSNCDTIRLGTCALPKGIDALGNTTDYFTYHWQVIDSLSDLSLGNPYLSDTSLSEISIFVLSNTTLQLTVTHIDTITGHVICTDIDTVTILPDPSCCLLHAQQQYLDSATWAYQATGNNPNFTNTTVSINGDFYLNYLMNTTVNIVNCEFIFGPKGRIIVDPSITLNIDSSYFHGCSQMWNGILVLGNFFNTNLNITNSVFEDADTAIHFMTQATGLHLVGNTFNKNYVDVYTTGIYTFPQTQEISSNIFNCESAVAPATYTPYGLRIPRNGQRSAIGVRALDSFVPTPPTSITLTVGSSASTGNSFMNHDYGILTTNLNLNANYNSFKNVNDNSINAYTFATPKGINIQCENTNGSNISGIIEYNDFTNGVTSIDFRGGVNGRFTRNIIKEMKNFGIVFLDNKYKSFRISANEIDNVGWIGIYGLNNPISSIVINQNIINNSNNSLFRTGIALDELTAPTAFGYNSLISYNTISNLQYGITETSVLEPRIYSNEISIQQTPWAIYAHGIRMFNCNKSHVMGNYIFGNNRDEWFVDGIRTDNGISGGEIRCNYTVKTGSGVFFAGASIVDAHVSSNVFVKNFWGVVLANNASIGTQGIPSSNLSNANQWTGSMANPDYAHTLAYSADGSLSPFYTLTGYPWQPIVNDVGGTNFNPIPWLQVTNNQNDNCILYRPDLDTSLYLIAPIGGGIDETELMMQINNSNFNQNEASSLWWSKASAYTQLKANDSIVPLNYDLVLFKDSVDLASLGKFTQIDKSLSDTLGTNIDSLKSVNISISSNNVIEDLMKELNSIKMDYVKYKALTALQINQLRIIAALCPHVDGPAVYTARALLRGTDIYRQEYMNNCEKVYPTSNSNRESQKPIEVYNNSDEFNIFPNPTSESVVINHYGGFNEITIEETSGKIVFKANLNIVLNSEVFDVSNLANGIYLLKLQGDSLTKQLKFVINK